MPKQPNTRASKVVKKRRTARADRAARRALTKDDLPQRYETAKALAKEKNARSTQVTGAAAAQAAAQVTGAAASQAAAQVAATAATQDQLQAILRGQRQLAAKLDEISNHQKDADERASKERATLRAMLGDDEAGRTDTVDMTTGAAASQAAAQGTGAAASQAAAQGTGAAASQAAAQGTTSDDSRPSVLTEHVMQQLNDKMDALKALGSGNYTTLDQHLAKVENIIAEIANIARGLPSYTMVSIEEKMCNALHTMLWQLNHGIVFFGDRATPGKNQRYWSDRLQHHRAEFMAKLDYTKLKEVYHYTDHMDECNDCYRHCMMLQAVVRAYNAKIFAVLHEVLDNTPGKGLLTINGHMCEDHQTLAFLISRTKPSHGLMFAWCEAWPVDRRAAMKMKIRNDLEKIYDTSSVVPS